MMNRALIYFLAVGLAATATAQNHGANNSAEKMKALDFLVGTWTGTQKFQMGNGQTMDADIVLTDTAEVEGRFLQEKSTTTLPGGRTGSAIHMISFDPKSNSFKAWWFDDTSVTPRELDGNLDGDKLVFQTPVDAPGPALKATYTKSEGALAFQLELKADTGWRTLFVTTYKRSGIQ